MNEVHAVPKADEPDRRETPRLPLRLNVEFVTELEGHRVHRLGSAVNVSSGGVYFTTDDWHDLKPDVQLDVRLSGLSGYGAGPLFRSLRARATVLRIEENAATSGKAGVAARFNERPCFEVYRWLE